MCAFHTEAKMILPSGRGIGILENISFSALIFYWHFQIGTYGRMCFGKSETNIASDEMLFVQLQSISTQLARARVYLLTGLIFLSGKINPSR